MPERLPRKGRASGGICACEAAAARHASLVAHLSSPSANRLLALTKSTHFGGCSFCAMSGILPCPSGCPARGERVAASVPAKLSPRGMLRSSRTSVLQALTSIATKRDRFCGLFFLIRKRHLLTVVSADSRALFAPANRDTSSKPPRCFRHWRRVSGFLEISSLFPPLAALRRFPPSAKLYFLYRKSTQNPGIIAIPGFSVDKKSTVVNDRAQFSVGTMRSHR